MKIGKSAKPTVVASILMLVILLTGSVPLLASVKAQTPQQNGCCGKGSGLWIISPSAYTLMSGNQAYVIKGTISPLPPASVDASIYIYVQRQVVPPPYAPIVDTAQALPIVSNGTFGTFTYYTHVGGNPNWVTGIYNIVASVGCAYCGSLFGVSDTTSFAYEAANSSITINASNNTINAPRGAVTQVPIFYHEFGASFPVWLSIGYPAPNVTPVTSPGINSSLNPSSGSGNFTTTLSIEPSESTPSGIYIFYVWAAFPCASEDCWPPGTKPGTQLPVVITFDVGGVATSSTNSSTTSAQSVQSSGTTPATASVVFKEIGLPSGTGWSIKLAGATSQTSGDSLVFDELTGSYEYQVNHVPGYASNVTSGSVLLDGTNIEVNIGFVPTIGVFTLSNVTLGVIDGVTFQARNLTYDVLSSNSENGSLIMRIPLFSASLFANSLEIGSVTYGINMSSIWATGGEQTILQNTSFAKQGQYLLKGDAFFSVDLGNASQDPEIAAGIIGPVYIDPNQLETADQTLLSGAESLLNFFKFVHEVSAPAECIVEIAVCIVPIVAILCLFNNCHTSQQEFSGSVVITSASPANLLVTSPSGELIGALRNGSVIDQIPKAWYSGVDSEPNIVWISSAQQGSYSVTLMGTGSGEVHYGAGVFINDSLLSREYVIMMSGGAESNSSVTYTGTSLSVVQPFATSKPGQVPIWWLYGSFAAVVTTAGALLMVRRYLKQKSLVMRYGQR